MYIRTPGHLRRDSCVPLQVLPGAYCPPPPPPPLRRLLTFATGIYRFIYSNLGGTTPPLARGYRLARTPRLPHTALHFPTPHPTPRGLVPWFATVVWVCGFGRICCWVENVDAPLPTPPRAPSRCPYRSSHPSARSVHAPGIPALRVERLLQPFAFGRTVTHLHTQRTQLRAGFFDMVLMPVLVTTGCYFDVGYCRHFQPHPTPFPQTRHFPIWLTFTPHYLTALHHSLYIRCCPNLPVIPNFANVEPQLDISAFSGRRLRFYSTTLVQCSPSCVPWLRIAYLCHFAVASGFCLARRRLAFTTPPCDFLAPILQRMLRYPQRAIYPPPPQCNNVTLRFNTIRGLDVTTVGCPLF